jgi:hypothetical protein
LAHGISGTVSDLEVNVDRHSITWFQDLHVFAVVLELVTPAKIDIASNIIFGCLQRAVYGTEVVW